MIRDVIQTAMKSPEDFSTLMNALFGKGVLEGGEI